MSAITHETLRTKYGHWGEHPEYPLEDWRREVAENDTRMGYWEWVAVNIHADHMYEIPKPEPKASE
jgi:hypothetical protein